ncbi:MAG: UTP--glucose-1-phosphate uridylyltransferase AglF [Candidatus Bathyarchaeota archaeon BA2]|nr:MAG: UTP--glucose-1-phosphate uridylyltransferase AglF [Candidatus Bathyarchaeota archaeon BA2]
MVPAAGLGTRLFPATKEQPKEMLPIFSTLVNGGVSVKPLLQMVFEQLYDAGFREFCFVVGRGKRSIEDHFTPDHNSLVMLKSKGRGDQALDLDGFYTKIRTSTIIWVNQPEPKGFGHAVLMAQPFVQNEHCLVHAGDTYIISENARHLKLLMEMYDRLKADAAFLVQKMEDPRQYGVIEVEEIEKGVYGVLAAVEKPEKPLSKLAIMPIYVFRPVIFEELEKTAPGKGGEVQLTDAIQRLVDRGLKVCAFQLNSSEARLDIGSPETYWAALSLSYQHFCRRS